MALSMLEIPLPKERSVNKFDGYIDLDEVSAVMVLMLILGKSMCY